MTTELNLFELATRNAYRFNFKGVITVEDLWKLTPENLNIIAVELYKQLQDSVDVNFIGKQNNANEELQNKLEIVKRIIAIKLTERDVATQEKERKMKKQQLLQLINQKENEQLTALSVDELRKQLEQL